MMGEILQLSKPVIDRFTTYVLGLKEKVMEWVNEYNLVPTWINQIAEMQWKINNKEYKFCKWDLCMATPINKKIRPTKKKSAMELLKDLSVMEVEHKIGKAVVYGASIVYKILHGAYQ